MLLLKSKNKIYFYIILFFSLTSIINLNIINNIKKKFLINSIKINSNNIEINSKVMDRIKYVLNKNIFSLEKEKLHNNLNNLKFLENISIKKEYPSSINVYVNKTKFIATTYVDQKKYYVGENGKLIKTSEFISENELPIIFGQFNINEYLAFINILKKQNVNFDKINKFYFHKNKRWDLYFENNILIKFPHKNTINAIKLYNQFKLDKGLQHNTILDLRIPNRIVLKYE